MAIINAENLVLGRMATEVAERLLKGEAVEIVNAEKAVILGGKVQAVEKLKRKLNMGAKGNPRKGPKYSRMPDRIVRRAIRGMLPFKKKRGREAFKRLKVHMSLPQGFDEAKFETVKHAQNKGGAKFITIAELGKSAGAEF